MAAARAESTSTRTPAKPTADQMRVLKILEQLDGAPDSRGSGKLFQGHRVPHGATDGGKEGGRPAGEGRAYGNLGITYYSFGGLCEGHRVPRAAPGDCTGGGRPGGGEGSAFANLGNADQSQGGYAKAIEYHTQHLAIAKEVGDRAGEGAAYGNLGNAYGSQGDNAKAIE